MEKERDSNIELLRIVSILLVIASHCILHSDNNSGILLNPDVMSWNHIFSIVAGTWGRLAVEIFVFISAYYMVDQQGIHSKKILKIGLQTWFWCLAITGIVYLLKLREFSVTTVIKELITPAYPQYWFITNFILFYLLVPYLQVLVKRLTHRQLKWLVVTLTLIITGFRISEGVSNLVYFGYLFLLAAFVKREERNIKSSYKIVLPIAFVLSVGLKLLSNDFDLLTGRELSAGILAILQMFSGFLTTVLAISIFYLFKNISANIFREGIQWLSSATLGIYVLHENILLRGETGENALIWDSVFHMGNRFYDSKWFPLWVLLAVVLTYMVCALLECVRIIVIDKGILDRIQWLNALCNKLDEKGAWNESGNAAGR